MNNNKYQIIAIMGKSGSGKDTLCKALLEQPEFSNAVPIISCTTRPIRDYEKDGVDYHYLTVEEFQNRVLNEDMIEATVFNNWCYGTAFSNLDKNKINIGVFNPEGVEQLKDHPNIKLTLLYVEADDKVRLLRSLNREDNPDCHEIVRRFTTDEEDFCDEEIEFLNPDLHIINNGKASIEQLAQTIAGLWWKGQIR